MANFFEGIGNLLIHPVREAKWIYETTEDVIKGDMDLKDVPGSHQRLMNDITVPLLGDNKLSKNSDAVAGAVVGSILAAPLIGGAMGGSSGAGASSGFGGFGTDGAFSKYFQPGGGGGGIMDSISGLWDKVAGPSDEVLGNLADMEAGGAVNGGLGSGSDALNAASKGFDWEQFGKMLQSIESPEEYKIQHSGGKAGGGFRFDAGQYKNDLLTREFNQLYNAPLQNKLY